MTQEVDQSIYSAMQLGTPYKKYKKTILGKVYLEVWNSFLKKPEGLILFGNPKLNQEDCFIEVWSEQEDVFLKRRNTKHFKDGTIQTWTTEPVKTEKLYSDYTDEEVKEIVNSKFMSLQATLRKADSEVFVNRLLDMAREEDRSEKIIKAITARISEIQLG